MENETINELPFPTDDDDDALLPDGWAEGDDIFNSDAWTGETTSTDVSGATDDPDAEENRGEETTTEEPPTTEVNPVDDKPEGESETPPTTETTPAAPLTNKLKFTARVDHKDLDVEMNAEDLPSVYQKAQVTDRVQAKLAQINPAYDRMAALAKSMGYDSVEAMADAAEENFKQTEIEKLTAEGVHPRVAQEMVERQMRDRVPAPTPPPAAEPPVETPAKVTPSTGARDFQAEIAELLKAKPALRGQKLPEEVVQAVVKDGKSVLAAYTDYAEQQSNAELAALRKENQILKQNAAAAAKAPVSSTTKGGATDTKAKDPFIEGFDSDDW